jgi:hypothetical protein
MLQSDVEVSGPTSVVFQGFNNSRVQRTMLALS